MELSPEQNAAIEMVLKKNVSVITGPPGSGKTTLVKELMRRLGKKYRKCLLTAPTGAACDRLLKATGIQAHVIAKVDFNEYLINEFRNCVVVIDEASMFSTVDFYRMLRYLQPIKVCLVGDYKQLACSDGMPSLNSLIMAEIIPVTRLTSNFRRKNDQISLLAKCVSTLGQDNFSLEHGDDSFKVIHCGSDKDVVDKATELFNKQPSQIITFTHKMANDLNKATQSDRDIVIKATSRDGMPIRDGDRVVCTSNLYGKNKKLLVANGVIGVCTSKEICYENGFIDQYRRGKFKSFCVPCRCIITHKAQGSEFSEFGIIVLTWWKGPPPLELIYTSLTRFKKGVAVLGLDKQIRDTFYAKYANKHDTVFVSAIKALYKQKTNELAWRFSVEHEVDDDQGELD